MTSVLDILPLVRDQGMRPTCLSIALSDGHMCARGEDPALAADYLHFHGAALLGVGVNDGLTAPAGVAALGGRGQPCEADCPYSPSLRAANWSPPKPVGQVWRRRADIAHLDVWGIVAGEVGAGRPTVILLEIDDVFFDLVTDTVAQPLDPVRARHAVLAVEVEKDRVRVRNSWGSDWGQGGYGWLSRPYITARATAAIIFKEAMT